MDRPRPSRYAFLKDEEDADSAEARSGKSADDSNKYLLVTRVEVALFVLLITTGMGIACMALALDAHNTEFVERVESVADIPTSVDFVQDGTGPVFVLKYLESASSVILEERSDVVNIKLNLTGETYNVLAGEAIVVTETESALGTVYHVANGNPDRVLVLDSPDGSVIIDSDYPRFNLTSNVNQSTAEFVLNAGTGIEINQTGGTDSQDYFVTNIDPVNSQITLTSPQGTVEVTGTFPDFGVDRVIDVNRQALGECFWIDTGGTSTINLPANAVPTKFNKASTASVLVNVVHTSPFRLTVPYDGYYLVTTVFTSGYTSPLGFTEFVLSIYLYVNGVQHVDMFNAMQPDAWEYLSTGPTRLSSYIPLNATDYVEMYIATSHTSSYNQPMFMGRMSVQYVRTLTY
jgi:hypothetical protein